MLIHHIIVPLQLMDQKLKMGLYLSCCADCTRTNAPDLESPEQLDRLFPVSLHKFHSVYYKTYLNVQFVEFDHLNIRTCVRYVI